MGELSRLSGELSSGIASNLPQHLNGDFLSFTGFERGLKRAESYLTAIGEKKMEVDAAQSALSAIQSLAQEISGTLLTVPDTADATLVDAAARDASGRFSAVLGTLNTQVGGRSLFAGVGTDGQAVSDSQTILSALELAIASAGAATAVEVEAVVAVWFGPGGDFDTLGYVGAPFSGTATGIAEGQSLEPLPRADDPRLRAVLSGLALGALLDRGTLQGQPDERASLAQQSGTRLLQADRDIVGIRSELGARQARIERAQVQTKSERDALEIARSELIGVDPFETATGLTEAENQLRALYALTSKLSSLTLTDYL
jgi:flagellar hook-associated protein 3 FlgL